MNRRRADAVVAVLVAAVLGFGGLLAWDAYRQNRAMGAAMGSMMGGSTWMAHGTNPLWYGLATALVAAVVVGLYLAVRESLAVPTDGSAEAGTGTRTEAGTGTAPVAGGEADGDGATEAGAGASDAAEGCPPRRVLDVLHEDERRVLEPVVASPGITQIELRDRSDFSKSKVSQTVSELEKRGLLYRERQGRTYRVYPSDEVAGGET